MTSLRLRMLEDMQIRNLAVNTQESYVQQVSLFARYFKQSPEQLGPEQIRAYQLYLTKEKKLATSSTLMAISALRFLYKVTLKKDWTFEDIIPAHASRTGCYSAAEETASVFPAKTDYELRTIPVRRTRPGTGNHSQLSQLCALHRLERGSALKVAALSSSGSNCTLMAPVISP
jgi:integrase/recombinase XerD